MKKTFVLPLLCCLGLFSCGESSSAYKVLKAQYDSIAIVEQALSEDLSQTDSLVASVLVNFQDIESVENMININPRKGELRKSERERIKDNMMLIGEKLKTNGETLEALSKKLTESERGNKAMRRTLYALKKTIKHQKEKVTKLEEALRKRNIIIGELDAMINGLNRDVEALSDQADEQRRELEEQEVRLNTVRYCIGTKRDLKDMKVLSHGRIQAENANDSYFTKADLRDLNQIATYSKDVKILTLHPKSSYTWLLDKEHKMVLNIKDAKAFWASSKVLVIQVD